MAVEHILSIQSHVTRDYVGNRACALALQLLGHEVDVINTVNFSSMYVHTGPVCSGQQYQDIFDGLLQCLASPSGSGTVGQEASNGAPTSQDYAIMTTGYVADGSVVHKMLETAQTLKKLPNRFPVTMDVLRSVVPTCEGNTLWVMDAVLGDNHRLYVPTEVLSAFQQCVRSADIVTPNEDELKWLLNKNIGSVYESLQEAIADVVKLQDLGPGVVFLTSCCIKDDKEHLYSVIGVRDKSRNNVDIMCAKYKKQNVYLGGCGDVLCALIVHELLDFSKTKKPASRPADFWQPAISKAISILQIMIEKATAENEVSIPVVAYRDLLNSRQLVSKSNIIGFANQKVTGPLPSKFMFP